VPLYSQIIWARNGDVIGQSGLCSRVITHSRLFRSSPETPGCNAPLGHFAITAPIVSAPAPLGRILPISLLRHHMVSSPSARVAIFPSPSPPASLQLRPQKRTYGGDSGLSVCMCARSAEDLPASSRQRVRSLGVPRTQDQAPAGERRRSHSSRPMRPRRASPNGTSERASTRPPKYRASGSLTTSRGSPTAFR
jgi:hypothetical protein